MTKRVVIVGGGFGGLHLIRHLEKHLKRGEAQVTLIDRSNYSLFTPLLYHVATGSCPACRRAIPARAAREGPASFPPHDVELSTSRKGGDDRGRRLAYDHVSSRPGRHERLRHPRRERHALVVRARGRPRVRHRILSTFEDAALIPDAEKRRELLSFTIVGAGPVGVELARPCAISWTTPCGHLSRHRLRTEPTITLIDGADRVVPGMDPRLSAIAQRRLEQIGVRIMLRRSSPIGGTLTTTKDGTALTADTGHLGRRGEDDPIVVASKPPAKDGRLVVDTSFRAGGRDDVLALGRRVL